MPGNIRVSVLKCVDLPAEATGGKYVSMKVGMGKREFQTKPSTVDGNKTAVWNSDFTYPVLNLRDNLMVILLDSDGNAISQTEILTPVIVEKGSLEELFPLKGGGLVHLKLSFVLTLEERMRIEALRESALEKKERRTVKKNDIQSMKPLEENKTSASDAAKGILQTIPENAKSKDDSQNEKNHITPVVALVPKESFSNEMQNEEKSINETSPASISPAIECVTDQQAPSHELKDISAHDFKGHGQHSLPQHVFNEALIQNKTESIEEGSIASNEHLKPAPLPNTKDTMKDDGDPGNSDLHESSTDGSMSPTPLADSPNHTKGEENLPLPNHFPESSQLNSVESSTNNSSDVDSPTDTGSGSTACGATQGLCERSSLHTVPNQSYSTAEGLRKSIHSNAVNLIDSRVNRRVAIANSKPASSQPLKGSAVKAKIKAFESALSSQTMRGDGKKNDVKAKIKAFESNLTQDPDYHNASPQKKNHKIEAERARQRLQAEAAAAQAAEAKRRAEEEELKLKSISDAPKRPLKVREENLLRPTETKEKIAKENPRSKALKWERMRLAELQCKGNLQYETLQLDLSAKQKELVEEPKVSEMLASQSSKTSEQKQDEGVQGGQSELYNHEPGKSVAEAKWITNEKAKQKHVSDYELIIEQRMNSATPRDSSEEEVFLSEKKLEDLVNDSANGGFIKQVVGAAALLATGALFMWMKGERMNRRARTIRPNYQPYFLSNDAATSKID